jgi:hypothetical protein
MLLLEVLARNVLSHHITCDHSTGSSSTSTSSTSSSQRSSSGVRLWQQLLQFLSEVTHKGGHGFLAALMSVPANHPELQPGLLALLASLHRLSRQGIGTQLSVADAAATHAKSVIHKFSDLGVPSLVDLRTWRAMIAPWVVMIGLYCCELARWLQRWQQEHLQALRQPKSAISRSKAAADAVLVQFEQFQYAAEGIIGHPSLQRVSDLWESGTDSSSSSSSSSGGGGDGSSNPAEGGDSSGAPGDKGAALVDEWQQWQQSIAAAGGGQQQQQRQESAAAAGVQGPAAAAAAGVHAAARAATVSAGVQADAATAANSQQFAAVPDALPLPPPPQQQQQLLLPAYGSLSEEFSLLSNEVTSEMEDSWHVVNHTRKHLKRCAKAQPRSSSSDDSDIDDVASEEEEDFHYNEYVAAAQRRVSEASTIQSSMQACLEYEWFTELIELLLEVGEGICAKVPVPWMCNNPHCTCMDGASELQLVGGKACVCGGCKVAR